MMRLRRWTETNQDPSFPLREANAASLSYPNTLIIIALFRIGDFSQR